MDRPADVTEWISQHRPEQQEQIRRLAELVHAADDRIAEAIKWHRLTSRSRRTGATGCAASR
jgi:uncharacterized protein YdhG (YjbR/CyaY superfamily)